MGWIEAYEHARRRGGVLLVREGPAFGLTERQVRDRARREAWDRPHHGQVVLPGSPPGHRRRLWSGALAVDGWVAGESALWVHGLVDRPPARVEIVIPHDRRAPERGPGLLVRRSRTLAASHLVEVDGLPVTSVARTIADVSARRHRARVRGVIIDARQRGLVELDELLTLSRELRGSTGMPLLRELCWELDATRCDSVLAQWLWDELAADGLTPDAAEHPVTTSEGITVHLDVAFIAERVAGETDGFGAHSERGQLNSDARRHNTLGELPWEVIHVTWDMLEEDRDGVLERFRAKLREAGRRV